MEAHDSEFDKITSALDETSDPMTTQNLDSFTFEMKFKIKAPSQMIADKMAEAFVEDCNEQLEEDNEHDTYKLELVKQEA